MVLQCGIQSGTNPEYQLMKDVLRGPTITEWKPYAIEQKWIYRKKHPHILTSFCSVLETPFNKASPYFMLSTE